MRCSGAAGSTVSSGQDMKGAFAKIRQMLLSYPMELQCRPPE